MTEIDIHPVSSRNRGKITQPALAQQLQALFHGEQSASDESSDDE